MRTNFVPVLLLFFCFLNFPVLADDNDVSLKNSRRIHQLVAELLEVVDKRVEQKHQGNFPGTNVGLIGPVQDILSNENDVDVLMGFAMALRGYEWAGPETVAVSFVYETAWGQAVRRIEEIGGPEALHNLELMRMSRMYDGAYSLILREAIDRLKAKEEQSKSQKTP
ncbi:MAG: hypothetical protein KDI90_01765 [Alphaproteobacteria bacterium]|nr:hypothetical protein [Alphaproteobacteria bacterium]MCB9975223.1 hypothetical protein [Rhodospirillales bacterium]